MNQVPYFFLKYHHHPTICFVIFAQYNSLIPSKTKMRTTMTATTRGERTTRTMVMTTMTKMMVIINDDNDRDNDSDTGDTAPFVVQTNELKM